MNGMNNGQGNNQWPNMDVVKGLLALIFGCMFMVLAYRIILNVILFSAGLLLVYYGLLLLKMKQAIDFADQLGQKIKRLLN